MGNLHDDLMRGSEECRETHISWVFLGRENVFKVKKPVDLGFLDFTTLEKRKAACEAEVILNRRLAPDVYRGVVPITRDKDGHHSLGIGGDIVDWAVHMRRLRDECRADVLLDKKQLGEGDVRRVARTLSRFHARGLSNKHISSFGSSSVIEKNIQENFDQSRVHNVPDISSHLLVTVEKWQKRFLKNHQTLFKSRCHSGRVRDGHGDLRLDHIYLEEDRIIILDCIEFNERFRFGDVAADIAFLSMDLMSQGRTDLAEVFLAAYTRESGDYELYRVIDFYESYRAHVRSKVSAIMANSPNLNLAFRKKARADARHYFLLAEAAGSPPLVPPRVIAVGGRIASGKSTVADILGEGWAAPIVDSDRMRKRILGKPLKENLGGLPWVGAYSAKTTKQVYGALFEAAEGILGSGRPVILDATFRSRETRRQARALARRFKVPFLFIECQATPEVCRWRLRVRENDPCLSDARESLWKDFNAHWEPVEELVPEEHIVLNTEKPVDENRKKIEFLTFSLGEKI